MSNKNVFQTDPGAAGFVHLQPSRPDVQDGSDGKPSHSWGLVLTQKKALLKPHRDRIEALGKEVHGAAKFRKPWGVDENDDTLAWLKFKTKDKCPILYDSRGQRIDPEVAKVTKGSIVRVKYEIGSYAVPKDKPKSRGVSLWPISVQIIKLVSWQGGSGAEDAGFDAYEGADGFVADDEMTAGDFRETKRAPQANEDDGFGGENDAAQGDDDFGGDDPTDF